MSLRGRRLLIESLADRVIVFLDLFVDVPFLTARAGFIRLVLLCEVFDKLNLIFDVVLLFEIFLMGSV